MAKKKTRKPRLCPFAIKRRDEQLRLFVDEHEVDESLEGMVASVNMRKGNIRVKFVPGQLKNEVSEGGSESIFIRNGRIQVKFLQITAEQAEIEAEEYLRQNPQLEDALVEIDFAKGTFSVRSTATGDDGGHFDHQKSA